MALRKEYQEQLQSLQDELNEMGSLCILSVQLAMGAVTSGDDKLIRQTIETNDIIDKEEGDAESLCLKLLLRQQPVATDLRRVTAALKMIYDLHRIGEQSADIADIARFIVLHEDDLSGHIHDMASDVEKMVSDSVNAFIKNDPELAREVMAADEKADTWFVMIKDDLISAITSAGADAEYCLEALMIAKYLEKIGDHAENVAGWVEYSITGSRPQNDADT